MKWLLLKDLQILRRSPLQLALLIIYPVAVSYTHLDVYKRQEQRYVEYGSSLDASRCLLYTSTGRRCPGTGA